MSRQTLNQIVLKDLEDTKEDIISYRLAVGTGIEDHYDPVLDDQEIVPALDKVIAYYKDLK